MESKFLKFRHPFTCLVSGPTGSGKTILVRRLLKNYKNTFHFENSATFSQLNVLWLYGQFQELYGQPVPNVNITYSEYLPELDELKSSNIHLVVVDDLMEEFGKNNKASYLFTRGSHHLNLSVIFIVQNLFHQSKHMRTISLNSQYLLLLSNFRDQSQIEYLGRQLFPGHKAKSFRKAYLDATSKPFGYLLIDLKPDTPDKYRLRNQLTEEELPPKLRQQNVSFAPFYYIIHD